MTFDQRSAAVSVFIICSVEFGFLLSHPENQYLSGAFAVTYCRNVYKVYKIYVLLDIYVKQYFYLLF